MDSPSYVLLYALQFITKNRNCVPDWRIIYSSTTVLYSNGCKGVSVTNEKTLLKNQPHISQITMRQYWLGKLTPNKFSD